MMPKRLMNLLLICLLAVSTVALAEGKKPLQNPEMRKEMNAYVRENIKPVLREKRLRFETQLTAQDKQELARLRTALQKAKAENRALRQQLQAGRGTERTPLTEAEKEQLKVGREKTKQLYAAASAIAGKYRPEMERLQQSLAPERTEWENGLKSIAARYNADLKAEKDRRRFMRYRQLLRPVNFLLWDVSTSGDKGTDRTEGTAVYPNPANSSNTIAYRIPRTGDVKITLLDEKGRTLLTLLDEQQEKGSHTLEVNLRELPNATYYYKIETVAGTETKRLIKR